MDTLWFCTTSSSGLWLCCLVSCHTKQTGCLSSSSSVFPCRLQSTELILLVDFWLSICDCEKASHRLFRERLGGYQSLEHFLLQTGHSQDSLCFQFPRRQVLQKLWPHDTRTGSLKMSQHTGQERSSSGRHTLDDLIRYRESVKKISSGLNNAYVSMSSI